MKVAKLEKYNKFSYLAFCSKSEMVVAVPVYSTEREHKSKICYNTRILTALFNNTRILKIKTQPTVSFFTATSIMRSSRETTMLYAEWYKSVWYCSSMTHTCTKNRTYANESKTSPNGLVSRGRTASAKKKKNSRGA